MAFLKLHLRLFLLATWLLPVWLGLPVPAGAQPSSANREYSLKAVFLYNFCQFIDWPETAFSSRTAPFVIGVIGEDPFGSLLEEAVQGEVLHGRPLRIERYRRPEEARNCQLLFIGRSESARTASTLAAVRGRSVVTVGETTNFTDLGGMIALITEQQRVRPHINLGPLRAANLSVSSKLLRIAEIRR